MVPAPGCAVILGGHIIPGPGNYLTICLECACPMKIQGLVLNPNPIPELMCLYVCDGANAPTRS
uniref:Uncharacterized protein n=1 Tax=viral metagenome TaxID=1070528 RepID=A0A6M3M7L2_9ZZZZ